MQEEYITGVWYETKDRVDKAFTRALVYSDKGNFILRPPEIVFFGKKFEISMDNIQRISMYKPKHLATKGVPYIKIDYKDKNNQSQSAYFMKGALTIFKAKKETESLFLKLQNLFSN